MICLEKEDLEQEDSDEGLEDSILELEATLSLISEGLIWEI